MSLQREEDSLNREHLSTVMEYCELSRENIKLLDILVCFRTEFES